MVVLNLSVLFGTINHGTLLDHFFVLELSGIGIAVQPLAPETWGTTGFDTFLHVV